MIPRDERGFTLPEVLLTIFVIGIGIAAIMTVIPVGAYGVQEGKQLSTATFLANQRLEQVRNLAWVAPPPGGPNNILPANDCLGLSPTATTPPTVPGPTPCLDKTAGTQIAAVGTALPPCVTGSARACYADENATGTAATGIPGYGGYSRTVRIADCGVAPGCTGIVDAGMRLVTVVVTYTPLTARGVSTAQKAVTVNMVISQR